MFPSDRLTQAGATADELVQLEAEHEASTPEARVSLVKRLERIAEQDIREWLDDLRSALHFGVKSAEPVEKPAPELQAITEEKDEAARKPARAKSTD